MVYFDLPPRKTPTENMLDLCIDTLSLIPEQLPLRGKRTLFIFQPHDISHLGVDGARLTSNAIALQAKLSKEKGRRLTLFFEDANKRDRSNKRKINEKFRTTHGIDEYLRSELPRLIEEGDSRPGHPGDERSAYYALLYTLYQTLHEQLNKGQKPMLRAFFESTPSILRPTNAFTKYMEALQIRDYPTAINRLTQIIAFVAVRDLASAAELIQESNLNPDSDFVVIRGTNHLGLATCLHVLTEKKHPDNKDLGVDVDTAITTLQDSSILQVSGPILWKKQFWNSLFNKNPYLLSIVQAYKPNQDMNKAVSSIKKMLFEEPWITYLKSAVVQQREEMAPNELALLVLNQEHL